MRINKMPSLVDAFKALLHQSETMEFRMQLLSIEPILKDPILTRQNKRKALNRLVENLSEKTFKLDFIANMIIGMINMRKEVCQEFKNTDAQVNDILATMPRMKLHKDKIAQKVQYYRRQYNLSL